MRLRASITNEEPRSPSVSHSHGAVVELIRQLEIDGRWGKLSGIEDQPQVASIQAAANYHGGKLAAQSGWGIITRSQREEDGSYTVFIRKVNKE